MLEREFISQLEKILGEKNVLTSKEDLTCYSYDAVGTWIHLPEVVIFPTDAEQISKVLKLADEGKIPVTARGGGTNVCGASVPIKGGIVLCLTKMNKILEINKANLTAMVEPGVVLQDFNMALAQQGLLFPPDPQSFFGCTMGGAVAENAGGPACVKYGVVRQYVLGLEVVLASGQIVKLGGVTAKNRTGYELGALFTGSEGTLGIITKIVFRLLPLPTAKTLTLVVYDDLSVAGESVSRILASGVVPSKIELLDDVFMGYTEKVVPLGLPTDAAGTLLIETDGATPEVAERERDLIVEVCTKGGAREVRVAKDAAEMTKWVMARAGAMGAILRSVTAVQEDIAVPRDKIPEFIRKAKDLWKQRGLRGSILGHAGDGNLHPAVLMDHKSEELYRKAMEAMEEVIDIALSLGGVLSGEHGIGLEKQKFLKKAMDPVAIELMKKIKGLLDPNNILNPGKIWEA